MKSASPIANRSEQGVALVITLLLLSVITFMAITFLVVSRSERGAVATTTDQAVARLAADTALEQAQAQAVASMMAFTNPFSFGLMVSTNYINLAGFVPGIASPTNVNYDHTIAGKALTPAEQLQNLANLYYSPRPPVVMTNRTSRSNEFRFYLDLNRNAQYEPNGPAPVLDITGLPIRTGTNGYLTNSFVGDPEWIGGTERPDFPHSPTNKFIFRYAYVVAPAGNTLDLNYIHNYAKLLAPNTMALGSGDGFLRNQGVGTWEINLAALLCDLNTNVWDPPSARYDYAIDAGTFNRGTAFDDALALTRYRYAANPQNSLQSVNSLFGLRGVAAFRNDYLDGYCAGPVTNITWHPLVDYDLAHTGRPWSGADNTNHYFTPQDILDPTKSSIAFTNRLMTASLQKDSYNRYTYYRLLSALGTDSAPEANKINVNYRNVDSTGAVVPNMATNFEAWPPAEFFTNVANRVLANAGFTFTVTNIQVWPTNFYTPSVHRCLQLAANIYDATTSRRLKAKQGTNDVELPSVFRPIVERRRGGIELWITGFEQITNSLTQIPAGPLWRDLNDIEQRKDVGPKNMVHGLPLVIGAKKGLPNFNEFAMQTQVQVARKLQFLRRTINDKLPYQTNQMYTLSISNVLGVEGWNSYSNSFPRDLELRVSADVRVTLTNQFGQALLHGLNGGFFTNYVTNLTVQAGNWPGFIDANRAAVSFQLPLNRTFMPLTNSTYLHNQRQFVDVGSLRDRFESPSGFPVPHWWLVLNTRLRFILVDAQDPLKPIIDFVNLSSTEDPLDITQTLMHGGQCGDPYMPDGSPGSMWCTNRMRGTAETLPTYGVLNQIGVGLGAVEPTANDWNSFVQMSPPGQDRIAAIDFFRTQFGLSALHGGTYYRSNSFYAPFVPYRNIYLFTAWQANDPLVHYTIGDLLDSEQTNRFDFTTKYSTIDNLGRINERYEPWGGSPSGRSSSLTKTDLSVKDPLVTRSDDWDFPTNKLANIGWLGRVHRGTPWQTMYLKAPLAATNTWVKWNGGQLMVRNVGQIATNTLGFNGITFDAIFTQPWRDRYLLDVFTTAFNENATHGQMSINQSELAAWSAVLSGVMVLTNTVADTEFNKNAYQKPRFEAIPVHPAGLYNAQDVTNLPPVARIVNAINNYRATNWISTPHGTFTRLGDILGVPELTVASPFLNIGSANQLNRGLSDAAYERIPQQILGLLKAEPVPRFVIYSYGQALKPANRSIVNSSGPFFGMCTNYQVTAEVATRAVVRIEGVPAFPQPPAFAPALTNLHAVVESFNVLPPD